MDAEGREGRRNGRSADRRCRRVGRPRRQRQRQRQRQRNPSFHDRSGIPRRRLLARQQQRCLSSRSKPEREGLRGSRERQGQRGPLQSNRHDHDGNHAYNRDHDNAWVDHDNAWVDHDNAWVDHDNAWDDHHNAWGDHESGFVRKLSWERWLTGESIRRVAAFLGVGSTGQHAGAPAGAGAAGEGAGEGRTRDSRLTGCQQERRAAFHRVPRLGSCPARLSDARSRARASQSRKSRLLARPIAVAHSGHRDAPFRARRRLRLTL
jgi:hypothetical protein